MPAPLACLLSYGLTCAPTIVEAPAPTPLEPETPEIAASPARGAASKVLAKTQAFYDSTSDLTAKFEQTFVHVVYGTKKVTEGMLRVKKPGKMVWDYADQSNADFWVDGTNLYVVENPTKQVIVRSVAGSDIAGAEQFLFGGKQLVENFRVKLAGEALVKRYGMAGHTAIQLKPKKKNAHYKQLVLVVDDASGRVDAFVVLNGDNSTNHFKLSGFRRNAGLSESSFKFKKPKGFAEIKQ